MGYYGVSVFWENKKKERDRLLLYSKQSPKSELKRTTSWRGMDVLNLPKSFGSSTYINFASPTME
jgi:hypothetical protein